MKFLQNYIEEKQSQVFKSKKVFFAFSNDQFKESIKEHNIKKDVKIIHLGGGMYCPTKNYKEVIKQLENINKKGIEEDLKENGKYNVIKRELSNYESYYTYDLTDCIDALKDYKSISKEDIKNVFHKEKHLHYND